MKKKIIAIIMLIILIISTILILLAVLVEPITIKQKVFTYDIDSLIPDDIANYASGSKKAMDEAILDIESVDNTKVAIYQCSIEYNGKVYPFEIQIKDNVAPVAELVKVKWEIKVGDTLVAADMVSNVSEISNYTVYFEGDEPELQKTFEVPGTYNDVYIYLLDEFGNKSDKLRVSVSVGSDQVPPTLTGIDDKAIYVGTAFNPLAGVSAEDNLDGNITDKIVCTGEVDIHNEGNYRLFYTVKDNAGNLTKVVRMIVVRSEPFDLERVPDRTPGLFITKVESQTRYNYFQTIRKSKFTSVNNIDIVDGLIKYLLESAVNVNKEENIYSTSYSVIVEKIGNSKGFASAFKYMCDQFEISCSYVSGIGNSAGKAWNIVEYKGKYYHVDISYLFKNKDKFFYSTAEMKQLGYEFDEEKYVRCFEVYKTDA